MKKKILLGVGALVVLLAALVGYRLATTGKASPAATAQLRQGDLEVQASYCRPSKRGRLIFGEKDAGALVPFGRYWRLGANAATEISFSKDVTFGGKPVPAGRYRMYAVPGAAAWKIVLNSELGKWGAFSPSADKDVVSIEAPVEAGPPTELLTIDLSPAGTGARLGIAWDATVVHVPIGRAG